MDTGNSTNGHAQGDGAAYLGAWLGLLALTLLSFGAHYVPLGAFATAVSLLFATAKALIVFLIFMHLRQEATSVRVVAGLNIAGVVLLTLGIAVDALGQHALLPVAPAGQEASVFAAQAGGGLPSPP